MNLEKTLKYMGISVLVFMIISTLVSVIITVMTFLFTVVASAFLIGLLALIPSVASQFLNQLDAESESEGNKSATQRERIEKLKKSYLNNRISEEEFERRLDLELGGVDEDLIAGRRREREYNN